TSLLLRVQTLNIQMRSLRGRCALCAAFQSESAADRKKYLRVANHEHGAILRQGAPWGAALAGFLQAGIQILAGRRHEAIATFMKTQTPSTSTGMFLHAAFARRARGLLAGGDEGRKLVTAAEAEIKAEGILNPERLSAVFAPGLPTSNCK